MERGREGNVGGGTVTIAWGSIEEVFLVRIGSRGNGACMYTLGRLRKRSKL